MVYVVCVISWHVPFSFPFLCTFATPPRFPLCLTRRRSPFMFVLLNVSSSSSSFSALLCIFASAPFRFPLMFCPPHFRISSSRFVLFSIFDVRIRFVCNMFMFFLTSSVSRICRMSSARFVLFRVSGAPLEWNGVPRSATQSGGVPKSAIE